MEVGRSGIRIDSTGLPDICISGEIDFTNSTEVRSALEQAGSHGIKSIRLDLLHAELIDCSGISALVCAHGLAREAGCEITISRAAPQIVRALQLGGFASLFGLPALRLEISPSSCSAPNRPVDWNISESVAISEPDMIRPLTEVAVDAAKEAGLSDEHVSDIQLAVGEALANAVRHGSPNGPGNKVRVKCLSCQHAMVVEVTDEGESFDYAPFTDPEGEAENGGMGLKLMARAMDEVECLHTDSGNCVRMVKWLKAPSTP